MKTARCRVFPPRGSRIVQAVPGAPNGVNQVQVDVEGACRFLTELGPDRLVGVTVSGPLVQVWYWEEVADPADAPNDEVQLG